MAYISVDVDVDIDDIFYAISDREKRNLCKDLIKDGYGPEESSVTEGYHPEEEMYREAVVKLLGRYSQLTAEQIDLVKQLAG